VSDLIVTIPTPHGDIELTYPQVSRMAVALREFREHGIEPVWHKIDCGCCVAIHGPDGSGYVISEDGGADWHGPPL
jgi:hypothetical protein